MNDFNVNKKAFEWKFVCVNKKAFVCNMSVQIKRFLNRNLFLKKEKGIPEGIPLFYF